MRCARDPEVETNLTCGRCGTPICPKCLVQTPVGARCLKCADLKRLPTYEITHRQYLKAVLVGLGLALVIGIAWGWLRDLFSFWFLGFRFDILLDIMLLGIPAGYAVAELLGLSVNRKRGRVLQVIGAAVVILSYVMSSIEFSAGIHMTFNIWDILAPAAGIFVAVSRLR